MLTNSIMNYLVLTSPVAIVSFVLGMIFYRVMAKAITAFAEVIANRIKGKK
jgi:hypothetical protein